MEYRFADITNFQDCPVPENKRVPFGWKAAAIGGPLALTVQLGWPQTLLPSIPGAGTMRLRIAAALDVREELMLEVITAETRRKVGQFDIRYASVQQPFEIPLLPDEAEAAVREGVELRMTKGGSPFWLFTGGETGGGVGKTASGQAAEETGSPIQAEERMAEPAEAGGAEGAIKAASAANAVNAASATSAASAASATSAASAASAVNAVNAVNAASATSAASTANAKNAVNATAVRDRAPLLFPHLLVADQQDELPEARLKAMLRMLASLSSVQAFGWLEGCVLDGLLDLDQALGESRFRQAASDHLSLFFDEAGRLKYENPRSEPADGRVYGIEGTLPFAALARLQPEHPAIAEAVSFWLSHRREDGSIWDGGMLSAEGSYTVAYPMAVLAGVYGRSDLAEAAVRQLEVRREALALPNGDLFLRHHADGSRTFRHWARAHAWYMLGLVRTLTALRAAGFTGGGQDRCAAEFVRAAEAALAFQANDGLWHVFVDEPPTGADTSGSAGIAAALALGANAGLLPEQARTAAERALRALIPHLTPDGILGGVAQSNKGGEALQRSGYRVLFQMATGLMGQLYAALRQS